MYKSIYVLPLGVVPCVLDHGFRGYRVFFFLVNVSIRILIADIHLHLGILVVLFFITRPLLSLGCILRIDRNCFCRRSTKACRLCGRLLRLVFMLGLRQFIRSVELRDRIGFCLRIGDLLGAWLARTEAERSQVV